MEPSAAPSGTRESVFCVLGGHFFQKSSGRARRAPRERRRLRRVGELAPRIAARHACVRAGGAVTSKSRRFRRGTPVTEQKRTFFGSVSAEAPNPGPCAEVWSSAHVSAHRTSRPGAWTAGRRCLARTRADVPKFENRRRRGARAGTAAGRALVGEKRAETALETCERPPAPVSTPVTPPLCG